MKEKSLLTIAFICSLIGLIVLYFVSGSIEIDDITIDKINDENIDEIVKVKGEIKRITQKEDFAIMEISQESLLTIAVFDSGNLSLKNGDVIEVTGKVDEYNGKEEVIADEIKLVG